MTGGPAEQLPSGSSGPPAQPARAGGTAIDFAYWTIADHLAARRDGHTAGEVIRSVLDALAAIDDPAVLIGEPLWELATGLAETLDGLDPADLPLHGVPFAVKDNIDVAGIPTTAACPSRALTPHAHANVVARLIAAGAVPVAKTNLDQFATGLVGTRSPLGTPRNPHRRDVIPGGSSSGSAVIVARGLVPFSLGTDTAGSGRVPAALCGIVGFKPTIGRVGAGGVLPAVARFDCVSVFATSVGDAALVVDLCEGRDLDDPYSRQAPRSRPPNIETVGVPTEMPAGVDDATAALFHDAVVRIEKLGVKVEPVNIAAFLEAGRLLYGTAIVSERAVAFGSLIEGAPDADPVVTEIVRGAAAFSAQDAYRTEHRLSELRAVCTRAWIDVDAIVMPTTPGIATLAEVAADPIGVNSWLGTFTTFANLLDLAAVSVPMGTRPDGVPAGVQLVGPAWSDATLAHLAARFLEEPVGSNAGRGPDVGRVEVAVVGAHLRGQPLNGQLIDLGGRFVRETRTAPIYRLYALAGTVPPKPGMVRVDSEGASLVVEVWSLSTEGFGAFVAAVPPPLSIGSVVLSDASVVKGFLCEPVALAGASEITEHGGWVAYLRGR